MCYIKSWVGLVLLSLLKNDAKLAAASPSCDRVASQWIVGFTDQCTKWFHKAGSKAHMMPEVCKQEFSGGVAVDNFPWNDEVIVVDNEEPVDDFDLQPSQQVVQHGAGIVIVQTTWDMMEKGGWHARNTSSMVPKVHPEVYYLSIGGEKYVNFHVSVQFEPRGPHAAPRGDGIGDREPANADGYESTYDYDEDDDEALAADISLFTDWFSPEDDSNHNPEDIFSYEQELHDHKLHRPFELEHLESYSFGFGERPDWYWFDSYDFSFDFSYSHSHDFFEDHPLAPHNLPSVPHDAHTVTSLDVYVCNDKGNTLAQLSFYCDPNNRGTEQCYSEADASNVQALSIHNMKMYCDPECLTDEIGGLWCDIFDLEGCRMCSMDCSTRCNVNENCQCIQCEDDEFQDMKTPHPTPGATGYFAPSSTDDYASTGLETEPSEYASTSAPSMGPLGFGASGAPTVANSMEFETLSPTVGVDRDLFEIPIMSAAPTSGVALMECTLGDDDSCYDQLTVAERVNLESKGRGLTCEESCITEGGLWCSDIGLDGCRLCAFNCDNYCDAHGQVDDCDCFEC